MSGTDAASIPLRSLCYFPPWECSPLFLPASLAFSCSLCEAPELLFCAPPWECSPPFLPASLARCGSLVKLLDPPRRVSVCFSFAMRVTLIKPAIAGSAILSSAWLDPYFTAARSAVGDFRRTLAAAASYSIGRKPATKANAGLMHCALSEAIASMTEALD
jgi:hypothetical protein